MSLTRTKLYSLLSVASFTGYVWVYLNLSKTILGKHKFEMCLFKRISNFPCPSCGTTRSVVSILDGKFLAALHLNPIGYLMALILAITPFWLIFDLITNKSSLHYFYQLAEIKLRRRNLAIFLSLLALANWIWNLTKNL